MEKQSRVCDLGTACILLRYSFLCFSMGEVNASLIKSVSHSSGFYSVARMEGGEERGRGRKGVGWERGERDSPRLDLPRWYLHELCSRQCCSAEVSQDYPRDASREVVAAFTFQTILLAMQYLFRYFFWLHFFQLNLLPPLRRLEPEESKWAVKFLYFCAGKHSYEHALV